MNCADSTGKVTHLEVRLRVQGHIAGDVNFTKISRDENGRCTHPSLDVDGTKHALMNLQTRQRQSVPVPEIGATSCTVSRPLRAFTHQGSLHTLDMHENGTPSLVRRFRTDPEQHLVLSLGYRLL